MRTVGPANIPLIAPHGSNLRFEPWPNPTSCGIRPEEPDGSRDPSLIDLPAYLRTGASKLGTIGAMTPEKLGRYEILDELGKGAMGIVYLARDPLIGRQLALKTFRLGYSAGDQELEQFRERFVREAQSAGILSHPNIVAIHDVAVDPGGDYFIAMEYVEGTDLKILMQRQGRLDLRFAVEVVAQIADGLGYAHSKGVVHRDIKPANIIITTDKQAKITDFGIARVEASNLTVEGQLLGTPNYMAPEQIQGKEVDHRADIFSLGVMLYELLTGKKPFAADNLSAVTHRIVFEPFPPLEETMPGLPAGLHQVLDRALAKDSDERYSQGGEMAADLRAVFAQPAATAPAARSASFLTETPVPAAADSTIVAPIVADATTVAASPAPTAAPQAGQFAAPVTTPAVAPAAPQATGTTTMPPAATAPAATPPPIAAPQPLPAARPPAGAPAAGIPIAGRIAAVLGLVAALALVGIVISKLMTGDAETPGTRSGAGLEQPVQPPAIDPAGNQVPPSGGDPGEVSVDERLEAARAALRARDYPMAIKFAERVLAVDPEQQEGKDLFAEATEGLRRREVIRAQVRGQPPAQQQPAGSAPPPTAAPAPAPSVAGKATLVVELRSAVSEGRLTVFTGQQRIFQEPFKFVTGKSGMFRRKQKTSGTLRGKLTLASGAHDLRIYVWRQGAQTRTAEISATLPAGETRTLKIQVSEEGRVSAALE